MQQNEDTKSNPTAILLVVAFVYLVLNFPVVVYPYIDTKWWAEGMSDKRYAQSVLFQSVANLMMALNGSINFFLYLISGPGFRKGLKELFYKR